MTNTEAIYNLCNTYLNTFYPDRAAVEGAMFVHGLDGSAEAAKGDAGLFRCVKTLAMGFIEGSRSENGVSTSVQSEESIKRALRQLCKDFGLDDDELSDVLVTIRDGSAMW